MSNDGAAPEGPHTFPAYAIWTDVDIREPAIVHANTPSRARAICVRSMIECGFAEDWPDALGRIQSVRRAPEHDGNELGHRTAPGEGYSRRFA